MVVFTIYLMTTLIPIHGLLFLGIREERKKMRRIQHAIYKLQGKR